MDVYRPRKVSDEEIRGELMNKLHRLGMIWLKIGQKSQGYTNTGTRRRPGETGWRIRNKEREHLGFKTPRETEAAARDWTRMNGHILHKQSSDQGKRRRL